MSLSQGCWLGFSMHLALASRIWSYSSTSELGAKEVLCVLLASPRASVFDYGKKVPQLGAGLQPRPQIKLVAESCPSLLQTCRLENKLILVLLLFYGLFCRVVNILAKPIAPTTFPIYFYFTLIMKSLHVNKYQKYGELSIYPPPTLTV